MLDAAEEALSVLFEDAYEAPERSTEPAEASEAGDTPELTIDATGRAHGEDGKFVAKETTEEDASGEGMPEAPETVEEVPTEDETPGEEAGTEEDYVLEVDDPELWDLIESKYGGDVGKALSALKDAQSVIGRQGTELGELRELREQMADFQQEIMRQQQSQGVDWAGMIEEDAEQAAFMAVEYRDPIALEKAVEAWGQEDPFKAMMFMSRLQQSAIEEAQSFAPEQSLEVEVAGLKARYPDLQERLPGMQARLAERPVLAQALQSGDPRSRALALEDLYLLDKSRTTESDTASSARRIILKAKAETDAAKADATVVSATKSSAATGPPKNPNEKLEEVLGDIFGEPVPVV